jgi:hypothetical protein
MKLLILILSLLSLVFAANGLELEVSQGSSQASASMAMNYGADEDDFVQQHIGLNPESGTAENSWYFTGPGSTSRVVYGKYGGYAKSGFAVTGSSAQTCYDFALSNNPYASVSEALTSQKAKEIYAYAYASSNNGNQAMAKIDVYSPSNNAILKGYVNNAYATSSKVQVKQSASYASASSTSGSIQTDLWAIRSRSSGIKTTMSPVNIRDSSEVYVKMTNKPVLSKYPYTWTATAYADSSNTYAQQGFYGYAGTIKRTEYAKKYGYSGILRSQSNSGTHGLGQDAFTKSGSYGVLYPHWV